MPKAQRAAPGCLIVISGPSGAGKTAICEALLRQRKIDRLTFSVSATTRPPRPGERDGEHYHFMDREGFLARVARGEFLEWAEVLGNYYGTLREPVERELERGVDVLLDIDTQGAATVKQTRSDAVFVFIIPPTPQALEARIHHRGTESPEELARRLAWAAHELQALPEYDYAVVNDDLDTSVDRVAAIIRAERLRVGRLSPEVLRAWSGMAPPVSRRGTRKRRVRVARADGTRRRGVQRR